MLKEAPAHSKARSDPDPRLEANAFGDVVHIDTLYFTRNKYGMLEMSNDWAPDAHKGSVLYDAKTKDIDFFPTRSRTWKEVRDALIQFGGHRSAIKKLVSDGAPEFNRAARELGIAPVTGTPGRPTSHGVIEQKVRTALEKGRPTLLQSGLDLGWASRAIKHALLVRRLNTCNAEGVSI